MKREESKKYYQISCDNEFDFEKFIDKIYDYFELQPNKICANCSKYKNGVCGDLDFDWECEPDNECPYGFEQKSII